MTSSPSIQQNFENMKILRDRLKILGMDINFYAYYVFQ